MKQSITIRIPEPCHEDWNKMTPTEKGKFCNVCTKEVFDFTKTTDEDLVKKVYNKEKLCGRFKASQLNRELKLERKSGISIAPLAASFLLPFTLLASTKTGTNSKNNTLQVSYTSLHIGSLPNNSTRIQVVTIGKITDEKGKAIFDVEISSNESKQKEFSGLSGDYKIITMNDETIFIKKKGYVSQEIKVSRKSETVNIILKKEIHSTEINTKGKFISSKVLEKKIDRISEKKKDSSKISIKGTVTDDNGLPLPGVNIIVKGTSIGTQSDFDGNYKIVTDNDSVLVFTYVGFTTKEVTVANIDNTIDLILNMNEDWAGLIVVTGGISYDNSKDLMGYKSSDYIDEPVPWKKAVQQSLNNEKEYTRIKRERKKEARKKKKNN